jgi:hypothetical protein
MRRRINCWRLSRRGVGLAGLSNRGLTMAAASNADSSGPSAAAGALKYARDAASAP